MKSFRSSLFQKAGEVSGRSPESPAAAGEIPALQKRRRLLRNPRRGFLKREAHSSHNIAGLNKFLRIYYGKVNALYDEINNELIFCSAI